MGRVVALDGLPEHTWSIPVRDASPVGSFAALRAAMGSGQSSPRRPGRPRSGSKSSTSRRERQRRRSSFDRHLKRGGQTAVDMQAEMWLMPASEFVALHTLEPHQVSLEKNKLVRW